MKKLFSALFIGFLSISAFCDNPIPISSGGTGATTASGALSNLGAPADSAVVHNTGNESIGGTKTFTSTIVGNISGTATTASTVTNGVYTTGSYADPSWITALDSSKIATLPKTYTPTIGDGTNNFTTSSAVGKYQKIGDAYLVQIDIIWTGKGSAVAGSNVRISLPAAIGINSPRATGSLGGFTSGISFTGSTASIGGDSGGAYLNIFGLSNSGGNSNTVTVSQLNNSGEFQANVFYWDN